MNEQVFISVCIPSYNRPKELKRLLNSIDTTAIEEIEIIICEDNSPKREEIRYIVNKFLKESKYYVKYIENDENLGYDNNLRELIKNSSGEYIIFMGDDDEFVSGSLDKYINFLKDNRELGYILKTSRIIKNDGSIEEFRYYPKTKFFKSGYESFIELFRKSVFISGFTFKREYSLPYLTNKFDGSLLFQLYILAEITLKYNSAYCEILLTQQYEYGTPFFGSSKAESHLYTPGMVTIENSVNFVQQYFIITKYLDEKYKINSTESIKKDMSKYSYPILAIQRNRGIKEFIIYHKKLCDIGINSSIYYYVYLLLLIIFKEDICNKGIQIIKRILGRTPKL